MRTLLKEITVFLLGIFVGIMFVLAIHSADKTVIDRESWERLKEIDDEGFVIASQGMQYCASGMEAASRFDADALEEANTNFNTLLPKIDRVGKDRIEVLKKLGY